MLRKVYIILDYDGCGDIFSRELEEKIKKEHPESLNRFIKARKAFNEKLDEITRSRYGEKVEVILLSGSSRQGEELEQFNMEHNQNGHSLDNLERLAKKKKWIFVRRYFAEDVAGKDLDKIILQTNQLDFISKEAKKDERVDVYFFDDLQNILDSLEGHFKKHPEKKPNTIHYHLGLFDWKGILDTGYVYPFLNSKEIRSAVQPTHLKVHVKMKSIESVLHSSENKIISQGNYQAIEIVKDSFHFGVKVGFAHLMFSKQIKPAVQVAAAASAVHGIYKISKEIHHYLTSPDDEPPEQSYRR
jgi:hypothetical protein